MLHGLEDVETSTDVIAILLTATHENKKILLKIKNNSVGQRSCSINENNFEYSRHVEQ